MCHTFNIEGISCLPINPLGLEIDYWFYTVLSQRLLKKDICFLFETFKRILPYWTCPCSVFPLQVFGVGQYLEEALQCGEVVWHRGLLKKGYGLCHGAAGNAYAFLALYKLTHDPKHLYRACMVRGSLNLLTWQGHLLTQCPHLLPQASSYHLTRMWSLEFPLVQSHDQITFFLIGEKLLAQLYVLTLYHPLWWFDVSTNRHLAGSLQGLSPTSSLSG